MVLGASVESASGRCGVVLAVADHWSVVVRWLDGEESVEYRLDLARVDRSVIDLLAMLER